MLNGLVVSTCVNIISHILIKSVFNIHSSVFKLGCSWRSTMQADKSVWKLRWCYCGQTTDTFQTPNKVKGTSDCFRPITVQQHTVHHRLETTSSLFCLGGAWDALEATSTDLPSLRLWKAQPHQTNKWIEPVREIQSYEQTQVRREGGMGPFVYYGLGTTTACERSRFHSYDLISTIYVTCTSSVWLTL